MEEKKNDESEQNPRMIIVKVTRALFCPDGKDHFIIRNEDSSIYADTTNPKLLDRSKWIFENKQYEQYWEAQLYVTRTGKKHIKLKKQIKKDLAWED